MIGGTGHFLHPVDGISRGRQRGVEAGVGYPVRVATFFNLFFYKQKPGVLLDIICKLLRSEHNLPRTTNVFARGTTLDVPQNIGPDFFCLKLVGIAFYLLVDASYFHCLFFIFFSSGQAS